MCVIHHVPQLQRANIPQSILHATSTSAIDITDFGTPSASYPAYSCNIPQFFSAQQLVLDITLCGQWCVLFLNDALMLRQLSEL